LQTGSAPESQVLFAFLPELDRA